MAKTTLALKGGVMSTMSSAAPVIAEGLRKSYGAVNALDGVSLNLQPGEIYGLIGPDGAGKSSLLKIVAGVLAQDSGELTVFGTKIRNERDADAVKDRIGLMPQGLGQNLYADLSIEENIDYFGGLRLIPKNVLEQRKNLLLQATRLDRFRDRPMKNLSGGMKQKLGLVCTLIHEPRLVILDEPTTGVDPVSRREFWNILSRLLKEKQITALVSTAYMDEASRFHRVSLMHAGQVLASGVPSELRHLASGSMLSMNCEDPQQQLRIVNEVQPVFPQLEVLGNEVRIFSDVPAELAISQLSQMAACSGLAPATETDPELEDTFIALLRQKYGASAPSNHISQSHKIAGQSGMAIEARQLSRHFGEFKAVDRVSFQVPQGEIFGLLGANGAGKSTVIKMLTGILTPSDGAGWVAGADMRTAGLQIRERIGYMSQAFSLYLDLSVTENIRLYGGIYGLSESGIRDRMGWILDMAGLRPYANALTAGLPMGLRQRLALGCALIHRPSVLFLDEPTSGVDPLGRRAFWDVLFRLSREEKVTILVTTHYMSEAEHCDHIALMYAGRVVADASPEQLKQNVQSEAGQLLRISGADSARLAEVLQREGFASAAVFGPHVHVFVENASEAENIIRSKCDPGELIRISTQKLSMEDVFVHIVSQLEKQSQTPAQTAAVSTESV
ncbi:ATP-binding cassette domain-containing protein [Undibacterium squillarum]|uniref:ABC transporter ATP-binding protein n=1 Tax=Undibacterium squillarum TaxID=1131567 RepID=A0ABQ2XTS8_9BURK|nr:ATP-binding cassette domain-containing protein [Undibacterium squillarum]GGX32791.1 ABC transporter ATP-binding protein [Undibacterium squillarum]